MSRKRSARTMELNVFEAEPNSVGSTSGASTSAAGLDITESAENRPKITSKSLDQLPWRNGYLNMSALTAEDIDILCEMEVEDDGMSNPIEQECFSDEEWFPEEDEASDIEEEGIVNIEEEEEENEDLELEMRGEDSEVASKYIASDQTEWYAEELPSAKNQSQNILRKKGGFNYIQIHGQMYIMTKNFFYEGGPHRKFSNVMTVKEIFDEFFTENIKSEILRHSNKKGNEFALNFNQKNAEDIAALKVKPRNFRLISMDELDAFIGILLVMGLNGASDDPPSVLWGNYSHPLYKASLSRDRFQQIIRVIRFDSAFTRSVRKQTDKAAPISDIWNMLMKNLQQNYYPDENVTIDEQLFPYRGRTSFTQYIPSKPAKYGIKIFWLCNTANSYPLNGIIYTGKPPGGQRQVNVGENIVLALIDFYKASGINITTDNFFTSLPLANRLQMRGISLVGTLRQNKPYIPKELRPDANDDLGTPRYGFSKNGTLLSVVTKKNKSVYFLSTMHYTRGEPAFNGKEEINEYYNKTKGGVDVMDQMVSKYSTKRRTNRWPLALFF